MLQVLRRIEYVRLLIGAHPSADKRRQRFVNVRGPCRLALGIGNRRHAAPSRLSGPVNCNREGADGGVRQRRLWLNEDDAVVFVREEVG